MFNPTDVKVVCREKVLSVFSKEAQRNILHAAVLGNLSSRQTQDYKEAVEWVSRMRAKCKELIKAQDPTFASDSHWPEPSSAIKELAKAF